MANISTFPNASLDGPEELDEEPGLYAPVDLPLLVMCVLIIVTNSLVVWLFSSRQSLRTPSNVFLVSLASSDGVSGVFGVPLLIACSATTSVGACVPSVVFLRFSAVCAILHLMIIAFDRYGFIVHPLLHPSHMSLTRAILALFLVYSTSLIVALVQLSWLNFANLDIDENAEDKIVEIEKRYFVFCFVVFFCLPVLLASFSYGRIFVISVRHNRAILRQRGELGSFRALGRCSGSFVLCAMLFIFTICLLPNFVLGLQHHLGSELFPFPTWLEDAIVFLRFTPPLTNPILCTFFKQDFKQALRLWMRRARRYLISRCASVQRRQPRWRITYNSTPQSSRVVSIDCTCSDYPRNRVVQETTNFPESSLAPV